MCVVSDDKLITSGGCKELHPISLCDASISSFICLYSAACYGWHSNALCP